MLKQLRTSFSSIKWIFTYRFWNHFRSEARFLYRRIIGENEVVVFQALVIYCKAIDGEGLNNAGRPRAELDGTFNVHLVTDGDVGGEVVMLGVVAVGGSYSKISNN